MLSQTEWRIIDHQRANPITAHIASMLRAAAEDAETEGPLMGHRPAMARAKSALATVKGGV